MNNYPLQGAYPPNYYPQMPGYPQGYPPGYYPPPPQQGPPPGYNLGRAIMPNQAGNKARRIMSTLFNVGKELKQVERSAEYERGGITFNHMDKNRAYMNSTDDIEIVATQMDKLLKGEVDPEPSMPIDINSVQNQFMNNYNTPQPVPTQQPAQQFEPQQVEQSFNQLQVKQQTYPQIQIEKTNIMPIDVNQYINPQAAAPQQVIQAPANHPLASNVAILEKSIAEMNNKLEAIAKMLGMLVQGQKNTVTVLQQSMGTAIGDSVAQAVASAFNSYMEMQQQPEPEFDTSFVPDTEEVESEQA